MIFDEELFQHTITRERKRTERSGLGMVLLLIGVQESRSEQTSTLCALVADSLSAIRSDIDILGWYEGQSIMGLIAPEIDTASLATTCERLEAGFRQEIVSRFHGDLAPQLSISLRTYPENQPPETEEALSVDPVLFPEFHRNHGHHTSFNVIKRGMDILGSLALLVTLSPVLLIIAGLVKWSSPGPVIFWQRRMGHMMKPFMMGKFRTMYADADPEVHRNYVSWFISSSDTQQGQDKKNSVFKLTNDQRITPLGHFLRKTSIDELPQLWNVLVGEMSLVGPRPSLEYELQSYKTWHRHRMLEAKPGITGLWQVTGRSRTTFDEMVRLDLRYARERSLRTDIKILLATPTVVIKGNGAY